MRSGNDARRMEAICRSCLPQLPPDCLGAGRFADVLPLIPCRAASRLPAHPRTLLVFLFPYYTGEYPGRNLSRYAVVRDYHAVAGDMLEKAAERLREAYPGREFAPFVDNSPIPEVRAGVGAGLGVRGLHGLLIHPRFGSQVFIGTIVTDVEAELPPARQESCPGCARCLAACPTGAISRGRGMEKERCRSCITQKKGELTPWEEAQVRSGGLAWGCDLCADACPMNAPRRLTPLEEFIRGAQPVLSEENLGELLRDRPYGYRGKRVLLRNLKLLSGGAGGPAGTKP